MAVTFTDRDIEFEQWRDEHPNAFIMNHDRVPSVSYAVLHRADCSAAGQTWLELDAHV